MTDAREYQGSSAAPIPTACEGPSALVPIRQLETLRESIRLGNLLPGEGETLISCWIMAAGGGR